jgi:hypothetical protein
MIDEEYDGDLENSGNARMLFPVRLDAADFNGDVGRWVFDWTEQGFDENGAYEDAPGGRSGTKEDGPFLYHIADLVLSQDGVPCYAWARLKGIINGQPEYEVVNVGVADAVLDDLGGTYITSDWTAIDGVIAERTQIRQVFRGLKHFLWALCVGDCRDNAGSPNVSELMNLWFGTTGTSTLNVQGYPYPWNDIAVAESYTPHQSRDKPVQGLIRVAQLDGDLDVGSVVQAMSLYVRRRGSSPNKGSRVVLYSQPTQTNAAVDPAVGKFYTFILLGDRDGSGNKPAYAVCDGMREYGAVDPVYVGRWQTVAGLSFSGGLMTGGTLAVNLTTDVTGVLPVASGGTGLGTTPSGGQILIGNGVGYTLTSTIGAGTTIDGGTAP